MGRSWRMWQLSTLGSVHLLQGCPQGRGTFPWPPWAPTAAVTRRCCDRMCSDPLSSGAGQHCWPARLAWCSFQALHSQGLSGNHPSNSCSCNQASADWAWLFGALCWCSHVHKLRCHVSSHRGWLNWQARPSHQGCVPFLLSLLAAVG